MRIVPLWLSCVAALAAQAAPPILLDGIQPLTEQSFEEARRAERVDMLPYSPIFLRLTHLPKDQALLEYESAKHVHWSVHLGTPYLRVAFPMSEAKRKYLPAPALSLSDIDNAHVTISVSAPDEFRLATDVENVVLKRGTEIIQASSKRLRPHEYRNAMNATRTVIDGEFDFPLNTFAPTSSVTIVIVGGTQNLEITLTADMLRKIR